MRHIADLLFATTGLGLAACAATPARSAEPTDPVPASAPPAATAPRDGGQPAVLVPATGEDDPSLADDDDGAILAARIQAAVDAAAAGEARRWVIYAESTADYGCLCPPLVFAPFYNGPNPSGYPMIRTAPGVADPTIDALISARLRLTGRFTGALQDGFAWLAARGDTREDGMDEYARPGPVFVIDGWCAEPDGGDADHEAAAWRSLAARGLVCPGR